MIYTALAAPGDYGWGVCSHNLNAALARRTDVRALDSTAAEWDDPKLPGPLLSCLRRRPLAPISAARGTTNFGYTFFEFGVGQEEVALAQHYETIFAGSTWCLDLLREKGISNSALLLQGVDPALFYPKNDPVYEQHGKFVIFSGGSLSYRKGQDIVLAAVRVMQERHPDVVLVNAWESAYPAAVEGLRKSPYITFSFNGNDWYEKVNDLCRANGLDLQRVMTLPHYPHGELVEIYRNATIGLFPNRCESGTNLPMMEMMACGRPVIASMVSGHRDVLTPAAAWLLPPQCDVAPHPLLGAPTDIVWQEVSLEETIAALESAYQNRDALKAKGRAAAEHMKRFTWDAMAETCLKVIHAFD